MIGLITLIPPTVSFLSVLSISGVCFLPLVLFSLLVLVSYAWFFFFLRHMLCGPLLLLQPIHSHRLALIRPPMSRKDHFDRANLLVTDTNRSQRLSPEKTSSSRPRSSPHSHQLTSSYSTSTNTPLPSPNLPYLKHLSTPPFLCPGVLKLPYVKGVPFIKIHVSTATGGGGGGRALRTNGGYSHVAAAYGSYVQLRFLSFSGAALFPVRLLFFLWPP